MSKIRTIELVIDSELTNEELLTILNEGTSNLKELGIILREIRVVNSASSIIKGINYN